MFRTRLAGVAILSFCFLPGCGLFTGDRGWFCCHGRNVDAMPVSYPMGPMGQMGDAGGCGATVIPPAGGNPYGAPIFGVPGTGIPQETFPAPRIPRAGIDEGKGKQFELEGASRTGPVLTMPANGVKIPPQ
jgi:hypothetical protein